MPPDSKERGLYYYLMAMSKCLDLLGQDHLTDAASKKHDWRSEIATKLIASQKPDGSWTNGNPRWMENNPELCAGYALITLSYCAPRK